LRVQPIDETLKTVSSVSDEAAAIHREAPAIDLHADSLLWSRFIGYDLTARHTPPLPRAVLGGHVDIPRLLEGGLGAQFFGLVSVPGLDLHPKQTCLRQIDLLQQAIVKSRGCMALARQADDVPASNIAAFLGIEGAHSLEGDIHNLDHFAAVGVRYLGLLHFTANACGAPCAGLGADRDQGLTQFGHDVIARCEELGVLVDLSHINRRGFLDACAAACKPLIVSHTGVAGVHRSWRNIDDQQLRAVADGGGVVGVIFCPYYLGRDGIDAVVDHIQHIIDVVGEDSVALGSDWDGFIRPTRGLEEASKLPSLTQALLDRRMPRSQIIKLLRTNVMRVLREVPFRLTP